jgi:hypothetical protein
MRNPGWWPVLAAWALLALALLAASGLLAVFIVLGGACWLLLSAGWSLIRQQRAPSRYNQGAMPERYHVADDLHQPITSVVAAAEQDASVGAEQALDPDSRGW